MAKITRNNGPSNSGLTVHAFGGHVDAGLTERASGFSDGVEATEQHQQSEPPVEAPPFDPGEWSVADVMTERANCTDDQWAAVLEAERNGKNRAGIK